MIILRFICSVWAVLELAMRAARARPSTHTRFISDNYLQHLHLHPEQEEERRKKTRVLMTKSFRLERDN